MKEPRCVHCGFFLALKKIYAIIHDLRLPGNTQKADALAYDPKCDNCGTDNTDQMIPIMVYV